jgi:FkbM family methyltransferase
MKMADPSTSSKLRPRLASVAKRGTLRAKRGTRRALRIAGLGSVARAWDDAREPYISKRDRQDNANMFLLMRFALGADFNCIDIGANRGTVLREILAIAPQGDHLAFEPLPELAACLRVEFPTVDVREVALSDVNGEASFKHVHEDPAYSGLRERPYPADWQPETITVTTSRLDDCIPEDYKPDFVKIDVEGGEFGVLVGATRTLSSHHPLIIVEHGNDAERGYGYTTSDLHALLTDLGYSILDIDGHGPLSASQMLDLNSSEEPVWNWIARPR